MSFSRRRGRPKKITEKNDKGTNELIAKRKANITTEPLDLCAVRGLITSEQHNAGIRLRWLYTLKLGSPGISAYSLDNLGGLSCKHEDIIWLKRRQTEYQSIISELERNKARRVVMDVCIFNRMPNFLYKIPTKINVHNLGNYKELQLFITGLDCIVNMLKDRSKRRR